MKLVESVENALWAEFQTYYNVEKYLEKWQEYDDRYDGFDHIGWAPQFEINKQQNGKIDLKSTLHKIDGETLLKIAIDLGIDTPDFIPSIPTFKNELKSNYITAYDTFVKAYKQIETNPSLAIALANSALESIIKEILKNERINSEIRTKTLYDLTKEILKVVQLFPNPNPDMPVEIKTIGSSLLSINHSIEKLRSEKTNVHGKIPGDYVIQDSLYTYFIINSVATVGLFLNSYYKTKFPKVEIKTKMIIEEEDDLPF